MKIVYCLNSIRGIGGIQKVTVVKANALAEISDNEVYVVVTDNKGGVLTEPLSPKVHLIDLDVNYYQDDWQSKWNVLKGIFIKRREHKKRLKAVLNEIQPDVVISVGQSEKNMIPSIKANFVKIREFHYTKDYRMKHANSLLDKLMAIWGDLYDYIIFKTNGYDKIIILTNEDLELNWKGYTNVSVIPNPSTFQSDRLASLEPKKVVSVGRLSMPKNFASLIGAFKWVVKKHPDWNLEIYGEGPQKKELENLIKQLNLTQNVFLRGYTSDVKGVMADSSLYVLSSIFEGFALVLIEAMSCGLPVVAYACPTGPKDIISEGKDGFIVPVNDEKELARRICLLIEDENKRKEMGRCALEKSKQYQIGPIVQQWMKLFDELIKTKI